MQIMGGELSYSLYCVSLQIKDFSLRTPGTVFLRIIQEEVRIDGVQGEEILACQKRF
jgi:hypothetical protein